jgi:D-alanyl-D-alanine carboxypeptidase
MKISQNLYAESLQTLAVAPGTADRRGRLEHGADDSPGLGVQPGALIQRDGSG